MLTIVLISLISSLRGFYTFKARLGHALRNQVYGMMSLPMVGELDLDDLQGLFKPKLFCGSVMIL